MLQKLGDARAVDPVGLVSGHSSDLGRVDQGQMETIARWFQHIPHWYPIHPSRFHRHLFDPVPVQPLGQLLQIAGEGAEGLLLFFVLALRHTNPGTGHDGVAMYVQSGATAVDCCHSVSFCREPGTPGKIDDFPSRALRSRRRRQSVVPRTTNVRCPDQVHARA
jgi:hypothetical protein